MRSVMTHVSALILLLVQFTTVGCSDTGLEPETGSLSVTLSVTGTDHDPDGCLVSVDNGDGQRVLDGESMLFGRLSTGTHILTVSDIATNCTVDGDRFGPVTITPNDTLEVDRRIVCREPQPGRIAFQRSSAEGRTDIYMMRLDGSAPVRVTRDGRSTEPALSPDGSRIAFSGFASDDSDYDIFVINVSGTGRRNVTGHPDYDWEPTWSPDGSRLAFVSGREYNIEDGAGIFTVAIDGSDPTEVVTGHCIGYPDWSPDGFRIAYHGPCGSPGGYEILVARLDGSAPVNVSQSTGDDYAPDWSPDGTRIAFNSYRDGDSEIYVMNADGSGVVQLTHNEGYDGNPDWSPGGGWIAFEASRNENSDIYIMDADGGNVENLTNDPAPDGYPSWSY